MSHPRPEPPKPCPICKTAMQAKEDDGRVIFECHNCGMTVIHLVLGDDE